MKIAKTGDSKRDFQYLELFINNFHTATGISSFTDNTTKITVLDDDWIKVTVKFDNKKAIMQKNEGNGEADPWYSVQILQDDDDEVRIFGSHTILVNSITMFFIVTILLLLLTICLMNFFNYIPEQFKLVPTAIGSSHSSVDAESIASPEV